MIPYMQQTHALRGDDQLEERRSRRSNKHTTSTSFPPPIFCTVALILFRCCFCHPVSHLTQQRARAFPRLFSSSLSPTVHTNHASTTCFSHVLLLSFSLFLFLLIVLAFISSTSTTFVVALLCRAASLRLLLFSSRLPPSPPPSNCTP